MFQLIYIEKCTNDSVEQVERLRTTANEIHFLPDLHSELATFSEQLCSCVDLWSSYCAQTQTAYHQWSRRHIHHRDKRIVEDLSKNYRYLIELHQTVLRLQSRHQQAIDRFIHHDRTGFAEEDSLSSSAPYIVSDQA